MTAPAYDTIGQSYTKTRQADARILSKIIELLELGTHKDKCHLIDVGAGTCNYTAPLARQVDSVVALEPSPVMMAQAKVRLIEYGVADKVRFAASTADQIPFADATFNRMTCILATHHFPDLKKCLAEMMRVVAPGGKILILTADPRQKQSLWLDDYFDFLVADAAEVYQPLARLIDWLTPFSAGGVAVHKMLLPPDLNDLFFLTGWARPRLYLDAAVRDGISHFAKASCSESGKIRIQQAVARLESDLATGEWQKKYGETIRGLSEYDGGYRFLTLTRAA